MSEQPNIQPIEEPDVSDEMGLKIVVCTYLTDDEPQESTVMLACDPPGSPGAIRFFSVEVARELASKLNRAADKIDDHVAIQSVRT